MASGTPPRTGRPGEQRRFIHRTHAQPQARPLLPRRIPRFTHNPPKVESRRQGYPRLASFLSSDKDFLVFRSFSELHARVLLHKQDGIVALEEQLHEVDAAEPAAYHLRTRREDGNEVRKELITTIEGRLREYDVLLKDYFALVERSRAKREVIDNVKNWLEGNKPLVEPESTFLDDWDDLVAPESAGDKGGLDGFLERCLIELVRRGYKKRNTEKTDDGHVLLYSKADIAAASRVVVTTLAVTTLVAPIFVLFYVHSTESRLWIITLSASIFSSTLCALTESRNYELFSATAAFCAVMVVFVGSLPGTQPVSSA